VNALSGKAKKKLLELLLLCECRDMAEEIDETIRVLDEREDSLQFITHLPIALKKICHRKYRDLFYDYLLMWTSHILD